MEDAATPSLEEGLKPDDAQPVSKILLENGNCSPQVEDATPSLDFAMNPDDAQPVSENGKNRDDDFDNNIQPGIAIAVTNNCQVEDATPSLEEGHFDMKADEAQPVSENGEIGKNCDDDFW